MYESIYECDSIAHTFHIISIPINIYMKSYIFKRDLNDIFFPLSSSPYYNIYIKCNITFNIATVPSTPPFISFSRPPPPTFSSSSRSPQITGKRYFAVTDARYLLSDVRSAGVSRLGMWYSTTTLYYIVYIYIYICNIHPRPLVGQWRPRGGITSPLVDATLSTFFCSFHCWVLAPTLCSKEFGGC